MDTMSWSWLRDRYHAKNRTPRAQYIQPSNLCTLFGIYRHLLKIVTFRFLKDGLLVSVVKIWLQLHYQF